MIKEFFINGNIPSLKNSKIKTSRGIFPSKTVTKFLREQGIQSYSVRDKRVTGYKTRENKFERYREHFNNISYPLKVGFHFVRGNKRKFDYINAAQILLDIFTAMDFIVDDDCDHIVPVFYERDGAYYKVDKENPGVYVKIY